MFTGVLDWSWTRTLVTMRRIIGEVVNWQELVIVQLEDNELSELDPSLILSMYRLEVLELARNRISVLPETVAQHTTLRRLGIAQNRMTTLPVALGSMRSLEHVDVTNLPLTFPPQDVLKYGTENTLCYLAAMDQALTDQVTLCMFRVQVSGDILHFYQGESLSLSL